MSPPPLLTPPLPAPGDFIFAPKTPLRQRNAEHVEPLTLIDSPFTRTAMYNNIVSSVFSGGTCQDEEIQLDKSVGTST